MFYDYLNDDGLMGMAIGVYLAMNKSKKSNNVKLNVSNTRKITKEGRRVFDQMKEQAEDVEYEEFCD